MIEVAPLKGYPALSAMYSFQALMIGLSRLPFYSHLDPHEFFASFGDLTDEEKTKFLRLAILSVPLEKKEVEAIASFAKDKNGIAYTPINMSNLGLEELHEIMIAVGLKLSAIKIPWLSDDEKKKRSLTLGSMSESSTSNTLS